MKKIFLLVFAFLFSSSVFSSRTTEDQKIDARKLEECQCIPVQVPYYDRVMKCKARDKSGPYCKRWCEKSNRHLIKGGYRGYASIESFCLYIAPVWDERP